MTFSWVATYSDGTALAQLRKDGSENKYTDIDRERLVLFSVLDEYEMPIFHLHIPEGGRLIYRRRTQLTPGQPARVLWIVGCQKTERGVNSQTVVILEDNGVIHLLDNFKNAAPLNPPQAYENDQEGWIYEEIPS